MQSFLLCVCVCAHQGHSGKLKLAFTSPDIISTSPKSFLTSRIDFTVLPSFKFRKKHHLPVGQVKTEFASPIAQSTSPRLSDTAFFAHCGGGGGMMVPGIPSRDRGNLGWNNIICNMAYNIIQKIVIFYGLVHKINSIAWKRWLLSNTWILQWLEKRRIFMSQTWAKLQWWG